jgi:hypothetical protein
MAGTFEGVDEVSFVIALNPLSKNCCA